MTFTIEPGLYVDPEKDSILVSLLEYDLDAWMERRYLMGTEAAKKLEAEEKALETARKALAEADAVRYGNEKNYQRKLDRLKPFQATVEQHERNVEALKKELLNLR